MALVLRRDEVIPVIARPVVVAPVKRAFVANRLVEVALVVVELPVTTKLPLIVEDALERNPAVVRPPLNAIEVEVALDGNRYEKVLPEERQTPFTA